MLITVSATVTVTLPNSNNKPINITLYSNSSQALQKGKEGPKKGQAKEGEDMIRGTRKGQE